MFPLYAKSIGTPIWMLTALISIMELSSVISGVILGDLSDRKGRKSIKLLCSALYIIYPIMLIKTSNPMFLIIPLMLKGMGMTIVTICAAYIGDVTEKDELAKRIGILSFSGGIGFGIGPVIGGYGVDNFGFTNTFYIATIISILLFILIIGTKEADETLRSSFRGPQRKRQEQEGDVKEKIRSIITRRNIISIGLMSSLAMLSFRLTIVFFPLLGQELGISASKAGLIIGIRTIFFVLAQIPTGYMARKIGKRRLLIISLMMLALGQGMVGLSDSTEMIAISLICEGIGFGLFLTLSRTLIITTSKRTESAISLGIVRAISWPGQVILFLLMGNLSESIGLANIFIVGSAIILVGGIITTQIIKSSE